MTGLSRSSNIGFILAMVLTASALFYFVQVNSISTKGYEIKELEKHVQALKESNKRLEIESSALKSIESIQNEAQSLNLVPSGAVKYLPGSEFTYRN